MARRYDSSTTTFSPEGRLHQVEYAIEAINNAGTCVGILAKDGVVMASERKITNSLLAPSKTSEKTYKLSRHVACTVAGLTSDANILIDNARLRACQYMYQFQEPIPIEQLVEYVCNTKQAYTQYGSLRPYGVAFLFAGYDKKHGFQLYQSDPSGNYSGWKATVIGANNQAGKSLLKTDYMKDESESAEGSDAAAGGEGGEMPDVNEAMKLAVKVLNKTMDATASSPEKMELFVLQLDENEKGSCTHRILSSDETKKLMDEVQSETAASGDS